MNFLLKWFTKPSAIFHYNGPYHSFERLTLELDEKIGLVKCLGVTFSFRRIYHFRGSEKTLRLVPLEIMTQFHRSSCQSADFLQRSRYCFRGTKIPQHTLNRTIIIVFLLRGSWPVTRSMDEHQTVLCVGSWGIEYDCPRLPLGGDNRVPLTNPVLFRWIHVFQWKDPGLLRSTFGQ